MAKKIIDVSVYQGDVDFSKVKKAGIAAVIIRAGYGKGNIDSKFKQNIERAISAGLPVGIYWFSYAYTKEMAEKEAEYCIKAIQPYKVTLPVFFDWEYDSMTYFQKMTKRTATRQEITDMYSAFLGKVLLAGYKAGYYANPDYLANHLFEDEINGYYKWLAYYTSKEQTSCDVWQYGTEYVDGISGKVDVDILNNERLLKSNEEPESIRFDELAVLKNGSKGTPVKVVQAVVSTAVDGIFGANTEKAVKGFQSAVGLTSDGIVGAKTWAKILSLLK